MATTQKIDKFTYDGVTYVLQDNDSGYTSNVGTVTGIKLNGSTLDPTNGIVDLGNIATSSAIPTITLNGTATTTPSFYAPTGAGTDGYYLKSNGSGAPSWTAFPTIPDDTKVTSTAVTAATTNYIVGSTSSSTTTGTLSKHASAVMYTTANTGTGGYTQLRLGNTTATSSAGGKEGQLRLYGTTATYYVDVKAGAPSANRTITFPNATGTIALTSDIPDVSGKIDTAGTGLSKSGTTLNHSNSVSAQSTQAVYPIKIDAQGHISGYGSAVTVPTITLNGSASTSPSFYAPTSVGTSGYYLKSNGSGAPSWTSFPNIPAAATDDPLMDGTAAVGTSEKFAKEDHVHPTDTSRQAVLVSGTNIKTINNESLLGSGNISISSGSSYTATAPIDITNTTISHDTSGVSAGTYKGYTSTKTGSSYAIPSFTVDARGHITAASDSGTIIPSLDGSGISNVASGLVDKSMYTYTVSTANTSPTAYSIPAGTTTKTFTISNPNYVYGYSYVRVIDVSFYTWSSGNTFERILADWYTNGYSSSSITLTVNLAQAYTAIIYVVPIVAYGSVSH